MEEVFERAYRQCGTAVLGHGPATVRLARGRARRGGRDLRDRRAATGRHARPRGRGAALALGIARLCLANAVRSSHRAGRRGRRLADSFVDSNFEGRPRAGPLEMVTVQGSAARLALTDDGDDGSSWMLAGQLPGGPLFLLLAPSGLTLEQVLEIAEQVTDTP